MSMKINYENAIRNSLTLRPSVNCLACSNDLSDENFKQIFNVSYFSGTSNLLEISKIVAEPISETTLSDEKAVEENLIFKFVVMLNGSIGLLRFIHFSMQAYVSFTRACNFKYQSEKLNNFYN